jgi:hypothetical protein
MTLKHTPGPWKVSRADLTAQGFGYSRFIRTTCKTPMDNAEHIAHVCALDNPKEDAANARLIAAAPELLAALEKARDWVALVYEGKPGHDAAASAMLRCIDSAITKAIIA